MVDSSSTLSEATLSEVPDDGVRSGRDLTKASSFLKGATDPLEEPSCCSPCRGRRRNSGSIGGRLWQSLEVGGTRWHILWPRGRRETSKDKETYLVLLFYPGAHLPVLEQNFFTSRSLSSRTRLKVQRKQGGRVNCPDPEGGRRITSCYFVRLRTPCYECDARDCAEPRFV